MRLVRLCSASRTCFFSAFLAGAIACGSSSHPHHVSPGQSDAAVEPDASASDAGASDAGGDGDTDPLLDASDDGGVVAAHLDVEQRGYDVTSYALSGVIRELDPPSIPLTFHLDMALTVSDDELPVLIFDSSVSKVMHVRSGESELPFAVDARNDHLIVDARALKLKYGGKVELQLDYQVTAQENIGIYRAFGVCAPMVYTHSQPGPQGRGWLPGHHIPHDRATFSIDLRVPKALDLIANGTRSVDALEGGLRHVRYQTSFPLSPGAMAFSIANFVKASSTRGSVPVDVWQPHCTDVKGQDTANQLADTIAELETRLGPFPFERFSAVAIYPASQWQGVSHEAGVAIVNTDTIDPLFFHYALVQQWIGGYVGIHGEADAWINEGMARLFLAEQELPTHSASGPLDLFGEAMSYAGPCFEDDFDENRGSDSPGTYFGASTIFSQVRGVLGEERFWGTWRALLKKHAFDSVSTADLLKEFGAFMTPEQVQGWWVALHVRGADRPEYTVTAQTVGDVTTLHFSLDGKGLLFVPVQITSVAPDGTATNFPISSGGSVSVPVTAGGYVAIDELDMLPSPRFKGDLFCSDAFKSYLTPTAPAALARFNSMGPRHPVYVETCTAAATP